MNILDCSHLMAVPGQTFCIDVINPETGRTWIQGQTPEEVQARCPGAQLMTCAAFDASRGTALAARFLRPPVEINEERWFDMLEVLPPEDWHRGAGSESFKMCERTDGEWTGCFVRIGVRYWELTRKASTPHAELVDMVRKHLADTAPVSVG